MFHVKHPGFEESRPVLSIVSALAGAALALGTALTLPIQGPATAASSPAAEIEFRLAETAPGPGLTRFERDGQPLYLHPEVLIAAADIASADQQMDPLWGSPVVSLVLTPAGRDQLARVTTDHVGQALAIVVDGSLLTAPIIREPILAGGLQISGLDSLEQAKDLAHRLGRAADRPGRSLAEALEERLGL
jgi:preprotein translocase subunit SecD